jgi:hypothetical protein
MGFFIVNNGDLPNCDQVQQLRCFVCFPKVVLHSLIEKKTKGKKRIIPYNTSFGIGSMKKHIESEHFELIFHILKKLLLKTFQGHRQQMMSTLGPCSQPRNGPK